MTRYVISRHGHVEGIDPPHFRGRTELPLSDRGRREIAALASRIAAELPPVAIYCSPLGRCVETARAVSEATTRSAVRLEAAQMALQKGYGVG